MRYYKWRIKNLRVEPKLLDRVAAATLWVLAILIVGCVRGYSGNIIEVKCYNEMLPVLPLHFSNILIDRPGLYYAVVIMKFNKNWKIIVYSFLKKKVSFLLDLILFR